MIPPCLFCVMASISPLKFLRKQWKKPGYERLCSTYVINPSNYKFGTTSICRVPIKDRAPEARSACDPTTGCMGCASGKGSGPLNIFGNKYGQHLAAVQVAREERMKKIQEDTTAREAGDDDEETDGDSDDNSENDFGPKEVTGIWAGAQELKKQATQLVGEDDAGDDETDDEDNEELPMPLSKKVRRA